MIRFFIVLLAVSIHATAQSTYQNQNEPQVQVSNYEVLADEQVLAQLEKFNWHSYPEDYQQMILHNVQKIYPHLYETVLAHYQKQMSQPAPENTILIQPIMTTVSATAPVVQSAYYSQTPTQSSAPMAVESLISNLCMIDENEVFPQFSLDLVNHSYDELQAILEKETTVQASTTAPYECNSNSVSAPESIQEKSIAITGKSYSSSTVQHDCSFTQAENSAIKYYTGSGYTELNRALRNKVSAQDICNRFAPVIETLNGALTKIKPFTGFVRRGTSLPLEVIRDFYKVGQVVREKAFVSTSAAHGFSGSVRFVILSKNCVNVDPISINRGEKEVLCPAGSEFVVMAKKLIAGNVTAILMEQIK